MFKALQRKEAQARVARETSTTTTTTTTSAETSHQGKSSDEFPNANGEPSLTRKKKTSKEARESELIGSKEHRKAQKKQWIEDISTSPEEHLYIVRTHDRSTSPIVRDMEDARNVLKWFRQLGFVGVKPAEEEGEDAEEDIFIPFVIKDFKLEFFPENQFSSAEEAAKFHDSMCKKMKLPYGKNFAIKRSTSLSLTGRANYLFNEWADYHYRLAVFRPEFLRNQVKFLRLLLLRLFHRSSEPHSRSRDQREVDLNRAKECWKTIRQILRTFIYLNLGANTPGIIILYHVHALEEAWRVGDALLERELERIPTFIEWMELCREREGREEFITSHHIVTSSSNQGADPSSDDDSHEAYQSSSSGSSESANNHRNKKRRKLDSESMSSSDEEGQSQRGQESQEKSSNVGDRENQINKMKYDEFRKKEETTLLRRRREWAIEIIDSIKKLYDLILSRKRLTKVVLPQLGWIWRPLRVQTDCIRRLQELKDMTAPSISEVIVDLEERGIHPLYQRESQYWTLLGEVLLGTRDSFKMGRAQRSFVRALELDPTNSRAQLALGLSEHYILDMQAKQFSTTMLSVSQKTTQTQHDDDDDDEMEEDRYDRLGRLRSSLPNDKKAKHAKAEEQILNVPNRINESLKTFPNNLSIWLARESLLFADDDSTEDVKNSELMNHRRVCLLNILRLDPTLSGGAILRMKRFWQLTVQNLSDERLDEFCLMVISIVECMTQRECPTYTSHFNEVSVPPWEYLTCALKLMGSRNLQFPESRKHLWRRRFFSDTPKCFQDPFSFTAINPVRHKISTSYSCRMDEYLIALKATVADRLKVSGMYYKKACQMFGSHFVNVDAIEKAFRSCGYPDVPPPPSSMPAGQVSA